MIPFLQMITGTLPLALVRQWQSNRWIHSSEGEKSSQSGWALCDSHTWRLNPFYASKHKPGYWNTIESLSLSPKMYWESFVLRVSTVFRPKRWLIFLMNSPGGSLKYQFLTILRICLPHITPSHLEGFVSRVLMQNLNFASKWNLLGGFKKSQGSGTPNQLSKDLEVASGKSTFVNSLGDMMWSHPFGSIIFCSLLFCGVQTYSLGTRWRDQSPTLTLLSPHFSFSLGSPPNFVLTSS